VIEISDSSLAYDLGEKKDLYAAGNVPEYWVVDIRHRQLHVFRNAIEGVFEEALIVSEGDARAPQAFPEAVLDVGKLFHTALD